MRTPALLAAGALGATLLAPPAHAEAGLTCGLQAFGDESGAYTGTVSAGPFVQVNEDGTTSPVHVMCLVQVNSPVPGSGVVFQAAGTGSISQPVTFTAAAGTSVYVCTSLDTGSGPRFWDADPATPGTQCALATHVDGAVQSYVLLGTFDICVWDQYEREIVCVPW